MPTRSGKTDASLYQVSIFNPKENYMKRTWTEQTALAALQGNVEIKDKIILVRGGVKGLASCSAMDYLKNHHGYILNLQVQ